MKRYILLTVLLFSISLLKAQSYKQLTDSALRLMWNAKDTVAYRNSLNLYEKAFKLFPGEINQTGFYKASVLASKLQAKDQAFNYLEKLLAMNNEETTTWSSLTFVYPQKEYENLFDDERWKALLGKAQDMKAVFFRNLQNRQKEFESGSLKNLDLAKAKDGRQAYEMIRSFNNFQTKKEKNYSIKFKVTDSLNTSYFVSLPNNYKPGKHYPVLFFLHGAVQANNLSEYQKPSWVLEGWNRFYTKYATLNEVIMVYPKGSRTYNWIGPDDGFFMVPAILKEIKQVINVDDDKVFISGHSNGATGSFSYLMKQQSPFAGFYGFNTQPKVRTGGTFVRNILNRSYFNVSTNEDYYFPPDANDSLNVIMTTLKADYQDHRYIGWPHWFPQFDESEPLYPMIFRDMTGRQRNPFRPDIYWECDDVKYGKTDWVQITQLDTLANPAKWHQPLNFNIHKLLSYKQNKLIAIDTLVKAFNFPRKSGVVKGFYKMNEFHLETSGIKSFSLFLSPEMIDMGKSIDIYVNGLKRVTHKPVYDKDFIVRHFRETYDRKAIWVDKIDVDL